MNDNMNLNSPRASGAMRAKALDTHYRGHLFRSRLEAKWAVCFDLLEIGWEYEKQGYALPNGEAYLPDFFLPSITCPRYTGTWIEIKPTTPTQPELKKMELLCSGSTNMGEILAGSNVNLDELTVYSFDPTSDKVWHSRKGRTEAYLSLIVLWGYTVGNQSTRHDADADLTAACFLAGRARFEHGADPQKLVEEFIQMKRSRAPTGGRKEWNRAFQLFVESRARRGVL